MASVMPDLRLPSQL